MNAMELMHKPVIAVREDCSLEEAAKTMLDQGIGCLPIIDDRGEMCGIVTESDFSCKAKGIPFSLYQFPQLFGAWIPKEGVDRMYAAARKMKVSEVMSRNVISAREDDTLETVLQKMLRSEHRRIPVVRGKVPVGVITRHDLLRLMLERSPAQG